LLSVEGAAVVRGGIVAVERFERVDVMVSRTGHEAGIDVDVRREEERLKGMDRLTR